MKVKSIVTIDFPKLNWGIHAGEVAELPEDKKAQDIILSNESISLVDDKKKTENKN